MRIAPRIPSASQHWEILDILLIHVLCPPAYRGQNQSFLGYPCLHCGFRMNMDGQDVQDIFLEEKKGVGAIREIAPYTVLNERLSVARKPDASMSYLLNSRHSAQICVGSAPGFILLPTILLPSSSSVELVVEHPLTLARAD